MASDGDQAERGAAGKQPSSGIPRDVQEAIAVVLTPSKSLPEGYSTPVRGYDFSDAECGRPLDYHALLQSYRTTGFQATNFGMAVEEITRMVGQRSNCDCAAVRTALAAGSEGRTHT